MSVCYLVLVRKETGSSFIFSVKTAPDRDRKQRKIVMVWKEIEKEMSRNVICKASSLKQFVHNLEKEGFSDSLALLVNTILKNRKLLKFNMETLFVCELETGNKKSFIEKCF